MSGLGRYCRAGVSTFRGNDADRAIALRPDGQSLSLGHRRADRDPAAARLADARHPSRPDAWPGDDRARLDRDDDPAVDLPRLLWRLTHPVAPESNLPPWQRVSSELVHWLLYLVVLLATFSGWFAASAKGWTVYLFGAVAF